MPLKNQHRRAVLALISVVATMVALVVPLVTSALAQGGPKIQIINPSDFADPDGSDPLPVFVSDRETGDDESGGENETTYRINAWTANTPTDAVVEFELVSGLSVRTIGQADRVAADTWEFNWDINVSGNHTLRAILYEGSSEFAEEVARDERAVTIIPDDPSPANTTAPAADLIYPENGGPGGIYVHPLTGATNILVDYEFSDETDAVYVFYTVSDVGDEPVWKNCATEFYGGAAGSGRLRCVLESIDQGGESVTGIAVVANDDNSGNADPSFHRSGDAVRVFPYRQEPTGMSVDRDTVKVDINQTNNTFGCSTPQFATVEDQSGRPISGISVDAHATGPSDQIKFDATGGTPGFAGPPSANQAPDKGHGNEGAYACGSPTQNLIGQQGDHNRVGAPDRKHVEARGGGVGDAGTFGVRLKGEDEGATQITFWADEDDDDRYCSSELAIAASIGWDETAPQPVIDAPEVDVCPIPTPPPPGGTPTATGTGSPTGSPSPTGPPDPRGCTVTGTEGDDDLTGTSGDDVICGLGGNDSIDGLGGNDVIHGDEGDDRIEGGTGNDTIDGGGGVDGVNGQGGNDTIDGGDDKDVVVGQGGKDTLRGNAAGDSLIGGGGSDILVGGGGGDIALAGPGDDIVKGASGKDDLEGQNGSDTIKGGPQNDRLDGGGGTDTMNGGPGKDRCNGGPGRDRQSSC